MKANGFGPILAALTVALMLGATAGPNGVSAQSAVDYDADDDGLIEIEWLEQLDAVQHCLSFCQVRSAAVAQFTDG